MALAFLEEDATAIGQPSLRIALTKRSASGKACTWPSAISASSRACFRAA
jgi:hypothetical protein